MRKWLDNIHQSQDESVSQLNIDFNKPTISKDVEECSDSNNSQWSQLQNPGSSHFDEMIKQRNRFNLHYHQSDIIEIPQNNRIPLLPNQERYDWIKERKVLSIQKNFRRHVPVTPQQRKRGKRLKKIEEQLSRADPVIIELQKQWINMSQAEREELRKKQSLNLLKYSNLKNSNKQLLSNKEESKDQRTRHQRQKESNQCEQLVLPLKQPMGQAKNSSQQTFSQFYEIDQCLLEQLYSQSNSNSLSQNQLQRGGYSDFKF